MKARFPLYLQIVLWLSLNLLVLMVAAYGFVKVQFRLGLDSLLLGRTGSRVEALAVLVGAQLAETSREGWNDVLDRFGAAYGVDCHLFRADGAQDAGLPIELPPEVRSRVVFTLPGPGPGFGQPGAGGGMRRGGPPEHTSGRRGLMRFQGPHPKFMVRTTEPRRYWVGIRIPAPDVSRGRPGPVTLLLVSDSLSGGGLFVDWKPWVTLVVGAVVFSVLFWLPLVHRMTRAIAQMTRTTEQLAEGRFEARIDLHRPDELGVLSRGINRMAERLEGFVAGQKRFLGDVAHELCSPIARIQMALGILDQRADDRQRAYVNDVRDEVQQMSDLIQDLLSFSRAGLRERERSLKTVPLADLVRTAADRENTGETGRVEIHIEPHLHVLAEPRLLTRAVGNLVRNALRYAGDAGPVVLSANARGEEVLLTVADSGPGVPDAERQRIFDPFYRLETSRSRETGGAGLGLAIVKTCVEACQGTVTAANRQPHGLEVAITLRAGGKPPEAPSSAGPET